MTRRQDRISPGQITEEEEESQLKHQNRHLDMEVSFILIFIVFGQGSQNVVPESIC